MDRIAKSIAAVMFVTVLPAAAQAQWYAGVDGGVNFLQDSDIAGRDPDGNTDSDKSGNKTGYALLTQVGYDFGGPKAEVELGYRSNGLKSLEHGSDGGVSGHTSSLSLMANGLYQFLPQSSWHPFVGAGIGASRVSARWKNGEDRTVVDDSTWVFAYQAMAGVSYDISKNWAVKAQYRYFATLDPTLNDVDGGSFDSEYASHSVLAGVTYKFAK